MSFIMYRGADQVSLVDNSLAGCFLYYADPQDALANHRFVEKVVSNNPRSSFDFLGKRFKINKQK